MWCDRFSPMSRLFPTMTPNRAASARRARRGWRPALEFLEGRVVLRASAVAAAAAAKPAPGQIYTVNTDADSVNDDNLLSLREAIMMIDGLIPVGKAAPQVKPDPAHPGMNTIVFAIPQDPKLGYNKATGTWTIVVGQYKDLALPPITRPVTINAAKPGTGQPTVELDGEDIFDPKKQQTYTNGLTLAPGSDHSVVSGLVINRFVSGADATHGNGILLLSGGNTVVNDYVGTDVTGNTDVGPKKQPLGNANDGVLINGAANNTVGNPPGQGTSPANVISGNLGNGVEITGKGATGNKVFGGHIGVNAKGDTAVPNSGNGVLIAGGASGNYVGSAPGANGQPAGAYNTISGNKANGVRITGAAAKNQVGNNLIGVQDKANGTALPNGLSGVLIDGGAVGNLIGGTAAAQRNYISGNTLNGVRIDGSADTPKVGPTAGNMVQGNFIGLAYAGDGAVANGTGGKTERDTAGVLILSSPLNMVGGTVAAPQTGAAPGNVISGNSGAGVWIEGAKSVGNRVQGNFIGTNKAGTAALGNSGDGMAVVNGPTLTQVGGTATQGNVISGNGASGVHLFNQLPLPDQASAAPPASNFIEGNLIGTDKNGKNAKMGNTGDGVTIGSAGKPASSNQIGPSPAMAGQQQNGVIAYNSGLGVNIVAGRLDSILDTSIYSNKANSPGIVLNQAAKSNDLIPAPTLTSVVTRNGVTTIKGTVQGLNNAQLILEVFDQAQGGAGKPVMGGVFQASATIQTDAKGNFKATLNRAFTGAVTTTVTDTNNNTSPFSDVATPVVVGALPPNANNDQYATAENTPLTVTAAAGALANDTDPYGLTLTAILGTKPAHGQLTLNPEGSFTYTPATNFFGADSFTYFANDGFAESNPATVNLTVTEVNQPPVANPVSLTATENTPLSFPAANLLGNDLPGPPDESGQTLAVTAVGAATGGTVALSGGIVTFTPAPQFTGAAGFTYTIEDNGTTAGKPDPLTATGTVTVNVAPPLLVATSTTVVGVPNPSVFGLEVHFTAVVTPASGDAGPPTGTVQFQIDGTDFGPPVPVTASASTGMFTASVAVGTGPGTGVGTATSGGIDTLTAGTHTVTAAYSGDARHTASTGTVTQVVNQAATSTSVSSDAPTSDFGQLVTFTAHVTSASPGAGTPTGLVAFKSSFPGGTSVTLGTAPLDATGTAVFGMDQLVPAGHTVYAVYLGDGNNATSTSATITQVVQPAGTTISLTSAAATTVSGQPNNFTLGLAVIPPGAPIVAATGTITVYDTFDGTTTALITLTLGQSGTSPALTAVGTHVLTAVYSGDDDYQGSTSAPLTVVVTAAPMS